MTAEDRILGYQLLELIGNWPVWVFRRVESIEYETASSIRRKVSVDLRLDQQLFSEPVFKWGTNTPIHYVPIALLAKQALTRFDVRDDSGRALPVMRRERNARITAAALSALAQSLVAARLQREQSAWQGIDAADIVVPPKLEADFWRIAYFNYTGRGDSEDAGRAFRSLSSKPTGKLLPVGSWAWRPEGDGRQIASVPDDLWRWVLARDGEFTNLAYDMTRLFPVAVPLQYEEGRRQLVKFAYTQHLREPESRMVHWVKDSVVSPRLASVWNKAEDWLEDVPPHDVRRDEWVPDELEAASEGDRFLSLKQRTLRWLGLAAAEVPFDTPAIGHAASYHLDITAPPGIQVRRAQLVVASAHGRHELPARRGHRSVRVAHLYASPPDQRATGTATVHLRPESSSLVRGVALASGLTALVLSGLYWRAPDIAGDGTGTEAVAAILVVVPGLIATYVARADEHPLATNLLFATRVLGSLPALLAVLGASLLVVGEVRSVVGKLTVLLAWTIALLLFGGWRLSARQRPHEKALK